MVVNSSLGWCASSASVGGYGHSQEGATNEGKDLLAEVVKKKKLDTKIDLLRADLLKILS
jgi:hypothetical protein